MAVCPTSLPAILKPVFSQMFPQKNVFLLCHSPSRAPVSVLGSAGLRQKLA